MEGRKPGNGNGLLDVRFENPPSNSEVQRRRSLWYRRLEIALSRQGQWCMVEMKSRDSARNTTINLRRGKIRTPNPDYRWEFRYDGNRIYFRYLGGKK